MFLLFCHFHVEHGVWWVGYSKGAQKIRLSLASDLSPHKVVAVLVTYSGFYTPFNNVPLPTRAPLVVGSGPDDGGHGPGAVSAAASLTRLRF